MTTNMHTQTPVAMQAHTNRHIPVRYLDGNIKTHTDTDSGINTYTHINKHRQDSHRPIQTDAKEYSPDLARHGKIAQSRTG